MLEVTEADVTERFSFDIEINKIHLLDDWGGQILYTVRTNVPQNSGQKILFII